MFSKDIGIDLGTANVLIHVKGSGVVLDEPSVVTIESDTKRVLAVGEEARRMVGRTPGNIVAIRPLRDGVIADFEITEAMLRHFINRVGARSWYSHPRILICAPTNITSVEQKAIREAAERSGAKEVFLEESRKQQRSVREWIFFSRAAIWSWISAAVRLTLQSSLWATWSPPLLLKSRDKFDEAIIKFIKAKYKLMIGERTAEDIKIAIGSVHPGGRQTEMDIRGRDMVSGLPVTVTVSGNEVQEALWDSVQSIIVAAKSVLERTPPELSADIIDRGVVLTGGGALLNGLDELLSNELHVPVWVAEDPMHCVVKGTGIMLNNLDQVVKKKF